MTPDFVVSAEYFYALGVNMPPEVSAGERYRIATGQDERQVRDELQRAVDAGTISAALPASPAQAARRLRALGALTSTGSAECSIGAGTPLFSLVQAWLDFDAAPPAEEPADDIAAFWDTVPGTPALAAGHLDLVLCAITGDHAPLIAAIKAIPIATVDELAVLSAAQWEALFYAPDGSPLSDRLPPFTYPGTHEERVRAFIRHVRKFFAAAGAAPVLDPIDGRLPPLFAVAASDPIGRFAEQFRSRAGTDFLFGLAWDEAVFTAAVADVFPGDADARAWLDAALRSIDELFRIADVGLPELRVSLMEALYARGFAGRASVQALSEEDFRDALTGTPAHAHAAALYANAGGSLPPEGPRALGFRPVNPGGPGSSEAALTSCVPPAHLSPLGPVAYLHEMLRVSVDSTCRVPLPDTGTDTLGTALAGRRGDLGALEVTRVNLETPVPAIDLVNESLEALAAGGPGAAGAVHSTPTDELAGHLLRAPGEDAPAADDSDADAPARHDAATLLAAVPAHSSPATPVQAPAAYQALRGDVSAPALPYAQPVDINRSYLGHLHTSRFETMRRFRAAITELALDPAAEPAGFRRHLWRYPVRVDIAREYLGLTAEEHALVFTGTIDEARLRALYGVGPAVGDTWPDEVARVSVFLERTGIDYAAFLALWRSGFVGFRSTAPGGAFADCEPCALATQTMVFEDPIDARQALARLAVFIRLWRALQGVPGAGYGFDELRDICDVLGLFAAGSTVNADFVRQLAAFQMLRDDFALMLAEPPPAGDAPAGATGADRTHLLALWVGPTAPRWPWAVQHLLDQLRHHAQACYGCEPRLPELIELLAANLTPLSRLAGFDPDRAAATWHARPTHTLRFAEVLAKIYASEFTVGELTLLFTADAHLDGDDPFPLQPDNEPLGDPLELPDDMVGMLPDDACGDGVHSLWHLRRALLSVEVSDDEAAAWTWPRIEASLRDDFGFEAPADPDSDPLLSLARRFFPSVLAECGTTVEPSAQQFRTALAATSPAMWNTPADGPFRYDVATGELWTVLPLMDREVLAKLARVKPLSAAEQRAVRDLYYLPRVELARFGLLFENFVQASHALIEEPDEQARWAWFQRAFARCYARCRVIAAHLAGHVAAATRAAVGGAPDADAGDESAAIARAWLLLRHLLADENRATAPWESDAGARPPVTWGPQPSGGAFAALLGLTGTGLLGEVSALPVAGDAGDGELMWRELRGPMDAFGEAADAWCAPVPAVVPAMSLALTPEQARIMGVRNGFSFAHTDGAPLGGAQGVRVRWRGVLLVEHGGLHGFWAEGAEETRWRVYLRRGQKRWALLSRDWPGEDASATGSAPMSLKRGAYELEVEIEQPAPMPDGPEDVCRRLAGFKLSYSGPDTGDEVRPLPFDRLFLDRKDQTLADGVSDNVDGEARRFLETLYPSTLRDVRRTYQRAFKALLFARRFGLSALQAADSGQSELGYLLDHADDFSGQSYYPVGATYAVHQAQFDPNLLPLRDNYHAPAAADDQRVAPSLQRTQALFDWWERVFDYAALRAAAQRAPEQPVWLLFHEAAENHPDDPMHLLRHMGVDLHHAGLARQVFVAQNQAPYQVTSADLEDERWAVRAWRAETWLRALEAGFLPKDIRAARPDLWAADDPGQPVAGTPPTGNENLTRFVRDGAFENGAPRRYDGVTRLNDGLRARARTALVAYLCRMDRVTLPSGGFARTPRDLSELLLIDVEAGPRERKSRIEDAIDSAHGFVQRYRLGLEPSWNASPELARLWDRRFASLRTWEACKRRELFRENWIDWDELETARRTEGFRLLECELRRGTLTAPVPSTSAYWDQPRLPAHPDATALQAREPASATALVPARQGLALLGQPERHARPSWLAALPSAAPGADLPAWVEAAARLGTDFVRVAAAGPAPASAAPVPFDLAPSGCCADCGREHEPMVDEYYFWLIDTDHYTEVFQDADVIVAPGDTRPAWHQPETLPTLLAWASEPMVHLMWCRVHDGELSPPRRSHEGVRILAGATPGLRFMGRLGDSLRFEVDGGDPPPGHAPTPPPGFRYDLAADAAIVVPEVALPPPEPVFAGGLAAYPHFAHVPPGAPLVPTRFSPAVTVAGALRARCRHEEALAWYEQVFHPLQENAAWCVDDGDGDADGLCDSVVSDERARHRAVTLQYVETLLEWGDATLRAGGAEEAQKARLVFDTAARVLGERPRVVRVEDPVAAPTTIAAFAPAPAPLNPRLWALYERVDDRRAMVHARLDAHRLMRARSRAGAPDALVASVFGDSAMRDGWQHTGDVCLDEADWCLPPCPYRFMFMLQKAQELAGEVRGLGAALLSAYEKGDAEHLAALRQSHERQLLELALSIRKDQWRESDWQVQALRKTKEIAQTRRRYYQFLIDRGLIGGELAYLALTGASVASRIASQYPESVARALGLIPDVYVGPAPTERIAVGTKAAEVVMTVSRILNIMAEAFSTGASVALTQAGWQRREDEWRHQVEVLDIEIEQIERQILAAERRRDIALRELNNHQRQIDNSIEVQDFLRDKFTNQALYVWLQKETAALHNQMYELALHTARQAERAFNLERGHTARRFLPDVIWDDLHEGLQAGERLQLALRQMEKAYLNENVREYELTKHVSLRVHFPLAFLQLKLMGWCELEIPEWMFDLDYPGHYMRRIKNVSMSIPCVVGPYTGVHCRLTLLGSTTRVSPALRPAGAGCESGAIEHNGYPALPDDDRLVTQYAASEAIATSTGQNDAGLFQLEFRDERYLPFEYAGAVSRWRIELPPENNYFDLDTLSDLVLHVAYMAREGGEPLRQAAHEVAQRHLPDAGVRLFDARHELPNAWQRFQAAPGGYQGADKARALELRLGRNMFAFLPGHRSVTVTRLGILFEAPGADPSAHRRVELMLDPGADNCDVETIECVASEEWPGFYHGVVELAAAPLAHGETRVIGTLRFPPELEQVTRMFLVCGYEAE
ncbi:neuraminidase-like domain-containing protein [Haliangium sp.]|uniref:Tc toxin subunit A-related protein n=1 Tax=Haliangium sp. TaxID=2663208 RepID=UPI003D1211CD